MAVNIHTIHIVNKRSCCLVLYRCARGPIQMGWCCGRPSCWLVLAR